MDLVTIIALLIAGQDFNQILLNPLAQFGRAARRYLGATLLPERYVAQNQYEEIGIRYRTVLANSGSRYSPAQKKGNKIIGSFDVKLGNSDIADEFTGHEYDTLIRLLQRIVGQDSTLTMQAMAQITNWFDTMIMLPMVELNEKERWDAIVDAQVVRTGDNGYTETVAISNPAGSRVAAGGAFTDDTYDPWDDVFAAADRLKALGYTPGRIIAGNDVIMMMAKNAKIRSSVGQGITLNLGTSQLMSTSGRATIEQMSNYLGSNNLPPIERYDLQYRTQTGSGYFLKRGTLVIVAATGRDETIDLADNEILTMQNTVGYEAIGLPVGSPTPGRSFDISPETDKPPRIEAQGWQSTFPVITEPQAIQVINTIH
jgi:hypothetical protein